MDHCTTPRALALISTLALLGCADPAGGESSGVTGSAQGSSTSGASSGGGSTEATSSGSSSSTSEGRSSTGDPGGSETSGTSGSSSGAETGSEAESSSTGAAGTTVTVRYVFGDTEYDCAAAGVSWVDVYVSDGSGALEEYSVEDSDCDDEPVVLPPMPAGSYSVSVVAWDLNLWDGSVDLELDGSAAERDVEVPLVQFPNP